MDKTAILATFVKIDSVATRKVARLFLEIPIEGVDNALDILGGYPDAASPVHVAIARLDMSQAKSETISDLKNDTVSHLGLGEDEKGENWVKSEFSPDSAKYYRKTWGELAYVTRAGIRSNEPSFQKWVGAKNQEQAAEWLRKTLGVKSRTEILPGTEAAEKFELVDRDYRDWLRGEEQDSSS